MFVFILLFFRLSSSLQSSSNSHNNRNALDGSDYVGVGYISHADNKNVDDVQTRISPSSSSYGSQSRYTSNRYHEEEEEEEDLQQRQLVPTDLSGIGASAYRAAHVSQTHDEEDTQKTLGVGFHDASVNNDNDYATRRRQQQSQQQQYSETETGRSTPQIYYVPAPITSSSTQRQQSSNSGSSQHYRISMRPGSSAILQVPVRVAPDQTQHQQYVSSRTSGYAVTENSVIQPTQKIVTYYVPATSERRESSSRNEHESSSRTYSQPQPEKYVSSDLTAYNSFNSRSQLADENLQESELQTRIKPYTPIVDSGSNRYSASSSSGSSSTNVERSQSRVVPSVIPAFPINTIESSSLHRTADEQQQRSQVIARPSYVQRTPIVDDLTSNNRRAESSSSYGSSGSTVYRVPITSTQVQGRQQQQQSSNINSRVNYGGNNYSPYSPSYTSSSRLGSGVFQSSGDSLHEYMSESQRLAELQQRQLTASNQQQSTSSLSYLNAADTNRRTVDLAQKLDSAAANFVSSSNLANRNSEVDVESINGAGTGGYQRVKSWQKQSQWESGKI